MSTPHDHHAPVDDEQVGADHSGLATADHGQAAAAVGTGHAGHDAHAGNDAHAGHDPHAGHDAHAGHHGHGGHGGHGDHAAQFRDKFWVSLVVAVPVVAFSSMFAGLLGYDVPSFPGSEWISPVLGTFLFAWGGWPFLSGGVAEARAKQPGMMLLIAMAITVAFVASWATTLGIGGLDLDFWWELALLVVIMLLGHWIEMRALGAASGALDALAALLPDTADRVDGGAGTDAGAGPGTGATTEVALADLVAGDVVLVRSGARVPADGVVVDGSAEMDESMVTGESRTVARGEGDRVVAGTVATDGALRVRVTAVGDDTALAGIRRLVAEAQASSSRAQALADRAAALLFWFASGAGVVTFVVWLLLGDLDQAITRTVTVLVIACPHALGLAIPLVIAISTERAARAGVLVKDRLALERMRTVDTVLFDKTGTLTKGEPGVTDVATASSSGGLTGDEALRLAAAAERDSEHPVARALVRAADAATSAAPQEARVESFRSLTGSGVSARVDGVDVAVGGPGLLRDLALEAPADLEAATEPWRGDGAAVLWLVRSGSVVAAFALRDEVRPESAEAVRRLHDAGVRVAMVTGDARQVADSVARELGIDEVFAEVRPDEKDARVAELQQRGQRVAMVGDGVNDAPALARADVGIAIGAGTDVAVESAGVVLASSDPRAVLSVISLSRVGYRKMIQNLVWGAGYNVLSVPLAAGVLAPVGFVLSPAAGAVLMSLSTVIVALNAQLLRRWRPAA
ncbi:heavy metal translocating P-type ATPase [Frigoribacterium sp. VKM Ac-2530]|uniref:heavy metal translocating P-type ATPase n=1 Tax=Frigoribacterium sp. VKM Ac-2530 TaxID=2783822 RepID=UPI00188A0DC4|nr:heavy metal translocating P-type ATPase [Frigoribacterium sp. VKM Ac-2530]MBF4580853.1 heavy metal translocating P-type ATPase [Frigoribacterium sp. VKM Ac-2530]